MPWLYNTHTGDVEHQNEAEWLLDQATGSWSGLVNLGIPDNASSAQAMAAAQKYAAAHHTTTPTTSSAQANQNAEQYLTSSVPGLSQVGDFFSRLTSANTWLRIGEGLLGVVLIAVGIARITNAVPIATKIARKL